MNAGKIFKVLVIEGEQQEPKIEVTLPIKLAKWALRMLPLVDGKIKAQTDIDMNVLKELLDEGFNEMEEIGEFELVKVNDGNTKIKISIEGA